MRSSDGAVDRLAVFFSVVHQDPILSRIKLIAEPWDLGDGGYQIGNFPVLWTEWNGHFRDTVRRFWRGERSVVADLGYRLTGSSDLFADDGRHPHASINLVTAHDGFPLRDLVSYERKHNLANGENNKDGLDDGTSQNCGVEGETADPQVVARRRVLARSIVSTLLLSQGVPMLEMGDELWRTERGNNNPYCHDSELTWVDWTMTAEARGMLKFVRELVALRKKHRLFRRHDFLRGVASERSRGKDITWIRPDGREMVALDWADPSSAAIAFRLDGEALEHDGPETHSDDSFLVLMNGEKDLVRFRLPDPALGAAWRVVVDSRERPRVGDILRPPDNADLDGGSLVALIDVSRESP
jgi:isoamylase